MCSGLMESCWTPPHSRFKSSGRHSLDVVPPLTQFRIRLLMFRRKLAVFRGLKMPFKKLDEQEIARINQLQQERFDTLVDVFEPPLPAGVPERLARIEGLVPTRNHWCTCSASALLELYAALGLQHVAFRSRRSCWGRRPRRRRCRRRSE